MGRGGTNTGENWYIQRAKYIKNEVQLIATSHKATESGTKSGAEMHKCSLLMFPHVDAHTDAHTHGRAATQSREKLYLPLDSASH